MSATAPVGGASPIRVIVSDVDGTLLDSTGNLPGENIAALQAACARGIRIALATIRKRDTAEEIVRQLDIPCGLVCEGGATAYDVDGSVVRRILLPWDIAVAIATMADDRQFPLATTIDAVNYYGPGYEPTLLLGASSFPVPNNREALAAPPTRMVIRSEEAIAFILQEFPDAELHVVRHYKIDGSFIDAVITHRDANKATAVEALLGRWGVSWSATIALGDAEADLGMLERAGLGVAMPHAPPAVRSVADYVTTPTSEAGVARAIERFVLDFSPSE